MKKRPKKEEFEIKWWKEWLEANTLKKQEMVGKLPIIKNICNPKEIPREMQMRYFTTLLNNYFEDLESAVYTKIRNEKKK